MRILKKIILPTLLLTLFSFNSIDRSPKEIAFQAVQVQSILREELYWIYINNPTLENESNYVDAKYVEGLLLKIVNDNHLKNKQTVSEAARVQSILKEELYSFSINSGTVIAYNIYVDSRYVESLILEIVESS